LLQAQSMAARYLEAVMWIGIELGLGYHDRHRAAEKDGLA
jgi:hypothetical protein